MNRILRALIVLGGLVFVIPTGASVETPESFAWTTDPASDNIQDGLCYEGVSPDNDIDCAGVQNWCDERETNNACNSVDDEFLCNDGEWACNNGERIEPQESTTCETYEIEAPGCYSSETGGYQCYSTEERFTSKRTAGCQCEANLECASGLCDSNVCVQITAPIITIDPMQ